MPVEDRNSILLREIEGQPHIISYAVVNTSMIPNRPPQEAYLLYLMNIVTQDHHKKGGDTDASDPGEDQSGGEQRSG